MAACMAQSMRLWGGSAAASKNVIRQHRSAPPLSTWLPCPSLISTGRSTPCLHCQASPLSSAAADQSSTGPPPVSPSNEKTPEENVNQLGWLWDRSAAATQRKLSDQKIRPKKSMGQNYVTKDEVLAAIVRAAGVKPGETVLEIGPGTGNLTKHLLLSGAQVIAIEKDDVLIEKLREEFKEVPQLQLIHSDILRLNLPELLDSLVSSTEDSPNGEPKRIRVVANLPYYITKDVLRQMLPMSDRISHLHFMLQDEVALRLTAATPGGSDYRAMNIEVGFYSQPRYVFKIDRTAYFPQPKVHGALVDFALRPQSARHQLPTSDTEFLKMVRQAFLSRRKMLRNSLQISQSSEEIGIALTAAGVSPDARAQDLTTQDFAKFAKHLGADIYTAA